MDHPIHSLIVLEGETRQQRLGAFWTRASPEAASEERAASCIITSLTLHAHPTHYPNLGTQ